ncbi:hypothetical protein [Winogradskyella sp. R77965]|uniref:glucosamine inositolphosphorylceramide transferase family protein n=1 Tax=Winogradskyella sp. R77965 TaxID=3093872 RepID=UPI0037DDC82D
MNKKLRIGLLTDNDNIPAWSHKMLERIVNSGNSEIVLIVKNSKTPIKHSSSFKKLWVNRNHIFWILYTKFENKLFKPHPNAFANKNIKSVVQCDEIIVQTSQIENSDYFSSVDIDKIKTYQIDVLINLCYIGLKGDILNVPSCGIWSYCHSERIINRGGPPGAWEVFKRQDVTGALLEILAEKIDGGKILARSYSSTEKLSVNRTNNASYWKALSLLPRKLEQLHSLGKEDFFNKLEQENSHPEFFDNQPLGLPKNSEVLSTFYKIYSNKIVFTIKNFFYFGQWIMLYKFEDKNDWATSFHEFKRIVPPKDRFWADPFVMERNGSYFIFFEELIYKENIGKIAVLEIDSDGNFEPPKIIIDKDYHLSYPFLIEEGSDLYMIPESSGNGTIELYKCTAFPLQWQLHKVLMQDVNAVDTTILKHNGKYWLFCNITENEGASSLDELFLFYSDSLLDDDWISHPSNPIVSDVSQSRPAGNIFKNNGKIFRPSQNSAKGYGHGMKINEIVELTTKSYKEETIQSIYPNWEKDLISTHTINNCNKLTVTDALIRRRR